MGFFEQATFCWKTSSDSFKPWRRHRNRRQWASCCPSAFPSAPFRLCPAYWTSIDDGLNRAIRFWFSPYSSRLSSTRHRYHCPRCRFSAPVYCTATPCGPPALSCNDLNSKECSNLRLHLLLSFSTKFTHHRSNRLFVAPQPRKHPSQ